MIFSLISLFSGFLVIFLAGYNGRVTVPVLWDKKVWTVFQYFLFSNHTLNFWYQEKTIVNNESSEIIRMFNAEFNDFCKTDEQRHLDLYPIELRSEIDAVNEWVYR